MTVTVFIVSLLAAMAIGMPIAYALLVCGLSLMAFLSMTSGLVTFDSQIWRSALWKAQTTFLCWPCRFFCLRVSL